MLPIQKAQFYAQCVTYKEINDQLYRTLFDQRVEAFLERERVEAQNAAECVETLNIQQSQEISRGNSQSAVAPNYALHPTPIQPKNESSQLCLTIITLPVGYTLVSPSVQQPIDTSADIQEVSSTEEVYQVVSSTVGDSELSSCQIETPQQNIWPVGYVQEHGSDSDSDRLVIDTDYDSDVIELPDD